jgi:hypothetical protein
MSLEFFSPHQRPKLVWRPPSLLFDGQGSPLFGGEADLTVKFATLNTWCFKPVNLFFFFYIGQEEEPLSSPPLELGHTVLKISCCPCWNLLLHTGLLQTVHILLKYSVSAVDFTHRDILNMIRNFVEIGGAATVTCYKFSPSLRLNGLRKSMNIRWYEVAYSIGFIPIPLYNIFSLAGWGENRDYEILRPMLGAEIAQSYSAGLRAGWMIRDFESR